MPLKALTANRLDNGRVVYLTPQGGWSEWLNEAALAGDDERAEAILDRGRAEAAAARVVEPYLIEVVEADGLVAPLRYREAIRARGPSVRLDLGKQAGAN
ncbi:MAG: DUF2849 domain-containing protein [Kiloniellales bacterium]|nr:DUF2849 domain-containing protein [Kiloniellales bacterium]